MNICLGTRVDLGLVDVGGDDEPWRDFVLHRPFRADDWLLYTKDSPHMGGTDSRPWRHLHTNFYSVAFSGETT